MRVKFELTVTYEDEDGSKILRRVDNFSDIRDSQVR
jgi:hypothetical protein